MSFWGRIFGSDKATEKLIDNVSSGLDKLWYTDEEKADDRAQARREGQTVMLEWMRNTQGQNLARRLIALSVTFMWLFMYFVSVIIDVSVIWVTDPDVAGRMVASSTALAQRSSDIVPAVMLILGFYFAAPHMGKIAETALIRFGQKNDKAK